MHPKTKRWINLALGTIVMLFLGLIYAWSVFAKPLETEFGWQRAQTTLTFTLSIIFFVVGLIASGFLSAKIPKWALMLIAAGCTLLGFVLCSRTNTLFGLYIAYGVLIGFGVGIANNALVSSIVSWFPEMKGIASGILMMGFGLGGLLLSGITNTMIEQIGWRTVFLYFGIAFGVIVGLGSLLVGAPPADFKPQGKAKAAAKAEYETLELPIGQMLRRPAFWSYIIWFSFVMAGGLLIIGHASPFAQELGADAAFGASVAGILSLFNGIGRVITGLTYDKLGLKISMRCTTAYLLIAAAFLIASIMASSMVLLIIGFVFTGLSYGGGPTTSSTFSSSYYGMKNFSTNYAAASSGMIPSALIGPLLAGVLKDATGGYLAAFIMMLAFGIIGLVALQFIKKP